MQHKLRVVSTALAIMCFSCFLNIHPIHAQCTAGNITKAHASTAFDALLDPDADGYITESGAAFTNGTTELAEFEIIPNSTTGWIRMVDVSETDSDITPNCGNPDLIQDGDGGDFAYYNIIDPTPASPSNGDAYILLRFRLAKSPNGNFGYNFLVDSDSLYGGGVDGNSTCGNLGFEREVQFANAGGKKGVSVYDIDGNTAFNSTLCNQCIAVGDVQEACAASSGACATSDPQLITLPVPLTHLGIASNISPLDLYIAAATANSGNATSVLGGGNVTDMGALDGLNSGCSCGGLAGCNLFDCQLNCINVAFLSLPVELEYFRVQKSAESAHLFWVTGSEENNNYFEIQHSTDGVHFSILGQIEGGGNSSFSRDYEYIHRNPYSGVNYYRLKQVDFDGRYAYSTIEVLHFDKAQEMDFLVIPSVATDQIRLEYTGIADKEEIEITIMDAMGRSVQASIDQQYSTFHLQIDHLQTGYYYIKMRSGESVVSRPFIKR